MLTLSLQRNANPKVMVRVLVDAKYEPLYTLVQYYQLVSYTDLYTDYIRPGWRKVCTESQKYQHGWGEM